MIYRMYSVRDVKVGFMPPTCDQSDISARRNFEFAINRSDNLMNFVPSDFDLFFVGQFDTDSGVITSEPVPKIVVSGASVFHGD